MVFLDPARKFLGLSLTLLLLLLSFLDEGMREEVGPSQSLLGVLVEQSLQEAFEVVRDELGVADGIFADVLDESDEIGRGEGRRARGQFVEDHSQAPQIGSVVVGLLLDYLGRHVERRALQRCQNFGLVAHVPREAEIAQLDDAVGGHQYVLRLHVAVGDAVGVDVVQRPDQLLRYLPDFRLFERLVVLDDVEELALAELSDEDELGAGFEGVEEEDDVFVLELLEDFDLVAHDLDVLLLLPLLLYRLDRHELPRELAPRLVHVPVRALPDQRYYVVVLLLVLAHQFKL